MGAWGHQNFENDDALDFVGDFRDAPTEATLVEALTAVIEMADEGEYIESDAASAALVAAEIVAASVGKAAADCPENLRELAVRLRTGDDPNMRKLARKAVKQVLKESELQELWADGGEPNEWTAAQQNLLVRLK